MLRGFKRFAIVGSTAISLGMMSTLAVVATTVGSGSVKTVAAGIAKVMAARPAIDASAGGGGAASGSPGVTITIAPTATLTARLLVQGTLTVTCGPLFNFDGTLVSSTGFISVQEAAGDQVAFGGGSYSFTCSGTPELIAYSVTAFNVPYHPGTGVADASFFSVCGSPTPFQFGFVCLNGDSGPTVITIRPST